MTTFFECPPIVAPTNDTVTVSNNAQLQQAIQDRANGGGNENILITGAVNNIYVNNIDDIHFWFLAGSSLTDNGSQPGSTCIRFQDSDNFGVHGVNPGGIPGAGTTGPSIDGNSTGANGARWGIVAGNSFQGDPQAGACTNGVIEGVWVHDVRQETIKVAETGTSNIDILCNEVSRSGRNVNGTNFFGEGIYMGQGSGATEFLTDILIQGNYIHEIVGGEGIDVKRGTSDIQILDNFLEDIELPFGGAITFWSDPIDAGSTGNSIIARNRVHDVKPVANAFTQTSDAVQVGDEVEITNNVLWDFTGYGVSMVRQFAGPGDTIEVFHNTIDDSNGVSAFGVNADAPNGGNDLGTMFACGNLWVDDHTSGGNFNGSTFQDVQYVSGFVGAPGNDGDGYALTMTSPHVDASPPCGVTNDICFEARPQGSAPDFGAFEIDDDEPVELEDDSYTGTVGVPFSQNVFVNDPNMGDAPTTCQLVSSPTAVPPGLTFSPTTGILSGTPTAAGTYAFVYECFDSSTPADVDTATVTVTIAPSAAARLALVIG